nr:hypothetical protein [Tanacetum cinerariifolium]
MHNNIMAAGSRDRPPMLTTGRYAKLQSRFMRYVDTKPNAESPEVPERTVVEIFSNIYPKNKAHYDAKKEVIHLRLIGIGDEIHSPIDTYKTAHDIWIAIKRLQQGESLNKQDVKTNLFWEFGRFSSRDGESIESYYSRFYKRMNEMYQKEVNEICAEKIVKNANPLALVAATQQYLDPYYHAPKSHKSYAPPSKQSSSTRSHASIRYKGKEIAKPITASSESASKEDKIDEQELEARYSFMAKIQKVLLVESGSDAEPLENVQYDAEYNADQNVEECDDERVVLANLIANSKLDTNENKNIQKQLKKENTSLSHELQKCKSALEECNRYLVALHDKEGFDFILGFDPTISTLELIGSGLIKQEGFYLFLQLLLRSVDVVIWVDNRGWGFMEKGFLDNSGKKKKEGGSKEVDGSSQVLGDLAMRVKNIEGKPMMPKGILKKAMRNVAADTQDVVVPLNDVNNANMDESGSMKNKEDVNLVKGDRTVVIAKSCSLADSHGNKDPSTTATPNEDLPKTACFFANVVRPKDSCSKVHFRALINEEKIKSFDCVLPKAAAAKYVSNTWRKFGFEKITRNDDGVYLFKFASKSGEVTKVPVWVKLYNVHVLAYSEDGLSLIATKIVTMAIPDEEGDGHTKEIPKTSAIDTKANTMDENDDGLVEVKSRKKNKGADSRSFGGLRLNKPNSKVIWQQKKGMDAKGGSSASPSVSTNDNGKGNGCSEPDLNSSNPFDVLNVGGEEMGESGQHPKVSEHAGTVHLNVNKKRAKKPSSSKSPINDVQEDKNVSSSLALKTWDCINESDTDDEDAIPLYGSSLGGGNQLEDEDFDFSDGYEDQVVNLPVHKSGMSFLCTTFCFRCTECPFTQKKKDKEVELEKYKIFKDRTIENETLERKLIETSGLLAQKEHDIKEGLKIKAYKISLVKEKNDELVKHSLLSKSIYEGLLKEKNKSIQTIHMLAPKSLTYNGRPTFANPMYLKKAQSEKPCLYKIPYDKCDLANIFASDRKETLTLEQESRSKLNKDLVKPYDYTKQKSLYEIFKPPSREYLDQLARANEIRKKM